MQAIYVDMLIAGKSCPSIAATVFRDDRRAEWVMLSELSYDGCEFSSPAKFRVGERLRLYQRGQGLIEAKVAKSEGGRTSLHFETKPRN